ncbi:iron(III) transport system substrate-binding protein [Celeribacter indicus]|uniref:ABC transporter substrate-binding protein n=2 Tax=Celeribacter indicus TaxID=1208324 RepID=A0A0B5DTJ9_9RHOB|nr:ABC transporter substrate-binding protein [Celeribacter indicus]SDX05719.1 iron(III) transport system substrate-binding protein [Celeribacter indicus]
MMSRFLVVQKVCAAACLTLALPAAMTSGARAQDGGGVRIPEELVEAATEEGRLVWYESTVPAEADVVIDAFREKYPDIAVDYVSIGGSQRMARISQESMSGGPTADVSFDAAAAVMTLADQGFVEPGGWEGFGFDAASGEVPNDFMIRLDSIPYVTIYNRDLVPEEDVPQSYDDLLKDDYAGNWATWARPNGLINLLPAWGPEKTRDFVTELAATRPRLYRDHQAVSSAVAAGEVAMGHFIPYQSVRPLVERGAPVEVAFLTPSPIVSIYGYVPKFAEHPNAGKLFLVWLASPEGAAVFEQATGRGSPFKPATMLGQLMEGMETSAWNVEDELAQTGEITALEQEFARTLETQ